ncbi:MAG: Smr/MutS family protein [Candidatus Zixiibacteriota bacterium]
MHGKGIGVQRSIVHSVLRKHPNVVSFRHEGGSGGGWGATVVDLKP